MKRFIFLSIFSLGFILNVECQEQNPQAMLAEGIYQEEVNGELAEAIKTYKSIVNKYPDNRKVSAEALLQLGSCYEKMESPDAYRAYQEVINKYADQKDEVALALARVEYLDAYAADVNEKAEQYISQGNELYKVWEYESAIKEYETAMQLNPNSLIAQNAQYYMGQSYFKAGRYDEALTTFKNIIEENPKSTIVPVTELMIAQVQQAKNSNNNPGGINIISDENTIVDPETNISFTKIKTFTGQSDIITLPGSVKISPNEKFLLCENTVIPMDGSAPFELISYNETGIQASRGIWSPDGTKVAFFSGDALCVVPVSPETGNSIGPFKKIHNVELRWQSSPSWSPDGKELTYYGPDGNIWTINIDGSNLKQITDRDARELGPGWSPDGKIIAFGIGNRSLGLYDVEAGTSGQFMEVGMRCFPVWSPDGEWIMMDWQKHHFINLKEKSKSEITIPEEVGTFFSWSPKGDKMLYFRSSYHYDTGLKIASSTGGPSFEPVPYLVNWGRTMWSEDNKLMAIQGEDENGDIAFRIVPLTGGESFVIDLDNLVEGKPFPFKISSNLDKILFDIRQNDGKEDLYVVPISAEEARTTGPAIKIFDGWYREAAYNIKFSLAPDGEKVALVHNDEIWIAYTNGDEPIHVKNTTGGVGKIRWTPNGRSLLFNTRSGWNIIKNPGPNGSITKLLDDGKELEVRWPNIRFSPDCNRIAILSENQIRILSIDETKTSQILDFSELKLYSSWDLKWSPNGKNIAFIGMFETNDPVDYPDGKYQIFNIPLDGGEPIKVAPNDYDTKYGLSWSPDSKWIAYSSEKPVKIRPESYIWAADYKEILGKLQK